MRKSVFPPLALRDPWLTPLADPHTALRLLSAPPNVICSQRCTGVTVTSGQTGYQLSRQRGGENRVYFQLIGSTKQGQRQKFVYTSLQRGGERENVDSKLLRLVSDLRKCFIGLLYNVHRDLRSIGI